MARVVVNEVPPILPPPPGVKSVALTLTHEEASALAVVTGSVTGTQNSPRGILDEVYSALVGAGYDPIGYVNNKNPRSALAREFYTKQSGCIDFKD